MEGEPKSLPLELIDARPYFFTRVRINKEKIFQKLSIHGPFFIFLLVCLSDLSIRGCCGGERSSE